MKTSERNALIADAARSFGHLTQSGHTNTFDVKHEPARLLAMLLLTALTAHTITPTGTRARLFMKMPSGIHSHSDPADGFSEIIAHEALEEARIMGPTSEASVLGAADSIDAAVELMNKYGVARLNNVVPRETVKAVLAEVNQKLKVAQEDGDESAFGGVLGRENRYDVLLDPADRATLSATQAVQGALKGPLGELFRRLGLDSDAPIHEFSSIVSDPGSQRQNLHSDTEYHSQPVLFTVFLALQDIEKTMGPTLFLLGTHRKDAHELFQARGAAKQRLVETTPRVANALNAGDVAIYDSRLLHAGGENNSDRRRVMLYFSIANPRADFNMYEERSIAPAAKGRYTIGKLENADLLDFWDIL